MIVKTAIPTTEQTTTMTVILSVLDNPVVSSLTEESPEVAFTSSDIVARVTHRASDVSHEHKWSELVTHVVASTKSPHHLQLPAPPDDDRPLSVQKQFDVVWQFSKSMIFWHTTENDVHSNVWSGW